VTKHKLSDTIFSSLLKKGRDGATPALPLALIHLSAWNRYSANFVIKKFSEVHLY
jgi:hypothetical protein